MKISKKVLVPLIILVVVAVGIAVTTCGKKMGEGDKG
jgi:hypothetical protein